jgi:hypothetical protein
LRDLVQEAPAHGPTPLSHAGSAARRLEPVNRPQSSSHR